MNKIHAHIINKEFSQFSLFINPIWLIGCVSYLVLIRKKIELSIMKCRDKLYINDRPCNL